MYVTHTYKYNKINPSKLFHAQENRVKKIQEIIMKKNPQIPASIPNQYVQIYQRIWLVKKNKELLQIIRKPNQWRRRIGILGTDLISNKVKKRERRKLKHVLLKNKWNQMQCFTFGRKFGINIRGK